MSAPVALCGETCSCALTGETLTIDGAYFRYDKHRRLKACGQKTFDLAAVMRVGLTRTYSRAMFYIPIAFGVAALLTKRVRQLEHIWMVLAALCLVTLPLYWFSRREDLEVNTTQGRYLLPRKGLTAAQIVAFQAAFTRLKSARRSPDAR